jgi:hypothetical protein
MQLKGRVTWGRGGGVLYVYILKFVVAAIHIVDCDLLAGHQSSPSSDA